MTFNKFKTTNSILAAFAIALSLSVGMSACQKSEQPLSVEQQRNINLSKAEENRKLQKMLERQRDAALENATKNAARYFAMNPRFDSSWSRISHTDDQITEACPQGSGWAWVNIMKVEDKNIEKNKIWCSTSSRSLGCYIDADFQKGPHAGQAQTCNTNLNYPLETFK